jgi:hypothetical protein
VVDAAAIAGSYSDLKLVKSRSVCQVVVEIPIEQAERFIAAFGMPIPGSEKPVALALLNAEPKKPEEQVRRHFAQLPRSQQAALMCNDPAFQKWCGEDADGSAAYVRRACIVNSRADLDRDELLFLFRQQSGRMTERRG